MNFQQVLTVETNSGTAKGGRGRKGGPPRAAIRRRRQN